MGPNRKKRRHIITPGTTGRYEHQPHIQLALLNKDKDKTESGAYRIPQPPTKSGGLKHAYAIFESKFMKCFEVFLLPHGGNTYTYNPYTPRQKKIKT